jgi:hypothetical protein
MAGLSTTLSSYIPPLFFLVWAVSGVGSSWYLFPFGRANQLDPTRPITTIKTAWANAREGAGVNGRLHDSRHTLITELAESGAGDQTIMDIAGHVSRQMLKHYSHIRMQAKRAALENVWKKQEESQNKKRAEEAQKAQDCSRESANAQRAERESLQKSLQSGVSGATKHRRAARKPLKGFGSSGRTRTYNPSVNSRTACSCLALQTQDLQVQNFDFPGNWGDSGGTLLDIELRNRELIIIELIFIKDVRPSTALPGSPFGPGCGANF